MNEKTKQLAKQAGFYKYGDHFEEIIERFAALIRADEREVCADHYLAIMRDAVTQARKDENKRLRSDLYAAETKCSRLHEVNQELVEALQDMLNGWIYIRSSHGDLYGVGWNRSQNKAKAALAKAAQPLANQSQTCGSPINEL